MSATSTLDAIRAGECETGSFLPTLATLRRWQESYADLSFAYVKPAAGDRRVRVYVSLPR